VADVWFPAVVTPHAVPEKLLSSPRTTVQLADILVFLCSKLQNLKSYHRGALIADNEQHLKWLIDSNYLRSLGRYDFSPKLHVPFSWEHKASIAAWEN